MFGTPCCPERSKARPSSGSYLGDGCCSLNHSSAASTCRRAAASRRRRFAAAAPLNARETSSPTGTDTRTISPGLVGGTKVITWPPPRTIGSGCCSARLIRSRERSRSWATRGAQQTSETRRPPASPFIALTRTRGHVGWFGAVGDLTARAGLAVLVVPLTPEFT
jgi:hypothetical protein